MNEDLLKEVLGAIVTALDGERDRYGRLAPTHENVLRKERLRQYAMQFKVGGCVDTIDQAVKVGRAVLEMCNANPA